MTSEWHACISCGATFSSDWPYELCVDCDSGPPEPRCHLPCCSDLADEYPQYDE